MIMCSLSNAASVISLSVFLSTRRPPIVSILTLMTVWRVRGKIIRTTISVSYICTIRIGSSYNFGFSLFLD